MMLLFLSHSWKRLSRSASFTRDISANVLLAFLALMMLGYSLALGLALDLIITKGLKISDGLAFLNGLLIYYFVFEFMMRYFLQSAPVLDAQPYLHLPVRKSSLVHYILIRSALSVFNLSTLLLFAPYALTIVTKTHGPAAGVAWLGALLALSYVINYLVLIFKKRLDDSTWGLLLLISVALLFAASDYFGLFKMSDVTSPFFHWFVALPLAVIIPLSLLTAVYLLSYRILFSSLYPEEIAPQRQSGYRFNQELSFLRNFGLTGEWINTEIKLIFRNKRPRQAVVLSAFLLLYGLLFYTQDKYTQEAPWFLLFVALFITGIFMINYGQFLFSWQGSHFDFTLTRPVSLRQYLEAKYYLLCGVTALCFLLTIPYMFFGLQILYTQLVMTLFHLGVNVFIIMNFAMWSPKKIDLAKGSAFNYKGTGAAQWLMGFPILLLPYSIYLPFSLNGYAWWGLTAVGVVGLAGIAMSKRLLDFTARRLQANRYAIAASFRKD